jgi:hypothetical protein
MKKGVVVEALAHSINGRYGFSCKTHADLSSRLTEECPHSLTEKVSIGSFEYRGPMTLLVVATILSIYTQF